MAYYKDKTRYCGKIVGQSFGEAPTGTPCVVFEFEVLGGGGE